MDTASSSEADSEPQLCQVSSPVPYPMKYVYPQSSTTFVTPSHKVSASMSGDNTGDDSGYGCSGDGQGYLSYVPSRESLAKINPDTKSHYESDIDGESRNPRQYTKLQIGQGYTSIYTKIKLPQEKTFDDELNPDAKGDYKSDIGRESCSHPRQDSKSQKIWPEYADTYAKVTFPQSKAGSPQS